MFVFSYKFGSESAKAIAEALGFKRIKHRNSKFKGGGNKIVLNWGASTVPHEVQRSKIINDPDLVSDACNKLTFFRCMKEAGREDIIPPWAEDKHVALAWLKEGFDVCVREKLTGNSGDGLSICKPEDELKDAPLYTKYVPKTEEYRVHVVGGQAIDVQRKARKLAVEDDAVNWQIRNHDNGFIFARGNLEVPERLKDIAVEVCDILGLDFGGVDVIYNKKRDTYLVLEVNTAPGIEGATVGKYKEAIQKLVERLLP